MSAPLIERLLDVLVALGLVQRSGDRFAATAGLSELLDSDDGGLAAQLRSTQLQSADLVARAKRGRLSETAWDHTDPELLQAQGVVSAVGIGVLVQGRRGCRAPASGWPGEATFLEVGAGVGGVSIALCEALPTLRVTALEPAPAPFALAERNIARAVWAGASSCARSALRSWPTRGRLPRAARGDRCRRGIDVALVGS